MIEEVLRALLRAAPASFGPEQRAEVLAVHRERMRTNSGWRAVWTGLREVGGGVRLVIGLHRDTRRTGNQGSGGDMINAVWQDMRFGVRTLVRNPGFAVSAIAVLALGIGANTAIFSAVNAYFFRPLPFTDADRLVTIYETNPDFGWTDADAAPANLLDWRDGVDAFADVSAYSEYPSRITTLLDGRPELVVATAVLGNFFETLGVRAALGRTFHMDETWSGEDDVIVLGHDFWVRAYGADPGVIGRRFEADGEGAAPVIVGVMPEGFRFPSTETEVWYPSGWDREAREQSWFRRAHFVRAFARLAPEVTRAEAETQLQVVVDRLQSEYPDTNAVMGAGLTPMRDFLIRDVRSQLLVLVGAVTLLLVLACANVANLMLVRASDRTREVGLRRALGASRGRVARQVFTESAVVAGAGALLGLALGWVGVRAITAADSLGIDGATTLVLDHRVVAFTVFVAATCGLLFGTVPALRVMNGDPEGALRDGRTSSTGRGSLRAVSLLVTTEVALALLLVVGAGLMVRTATSLRQVDPGFTAQDVVAINFTVPDHRYPNRDEVLAFYDDLAEALEARPGVLASGTVQQLPLSGTSWTSQFQAEGWPPDRIGFEIVHRRADAAYFEAMRTPLLRGRLFERTDGPDDPPVVVINETFAAEHFPGEDPLGQRIAYDRAPTEDSNWWTIVGIVGDQAQASPGTPARAEVFENRNQDWARNSWVVVRGDGSTGDLLAVVRGTLADVDPLIPIARSESLVDVWSRSMARETFLLRLLAVFGVVGLLLATVGVYGVTAQAARRRTREIGIRMALGAGAPEVLRLMLRHGLVVIGSGLVAGLAAAFFATRALASFLYGVEPTDPATLGGVALLLGVAALIACYVPARRATVVDPVESLRAE